MLYFFHNSLHFRLYLQHIYYIARNEERSQFASKKIFVHLKNRKKKKDMMKY